MNGNYIDLIKKKWLDLIKFQMEMEDIKIDTNLNDTTITLP